MGVIETITAGPNPCPLQECAGDCDSDDDCAPGLFCYHRADWSISTIPGCIGRAYSNFDYCLKLPSVLASIAHSVIPSVTLSSDTTNTPTTSSDPTSIPSSTPSTSAPTCYGGSKDNTQLENVGPRIGDNPCLLQKCAGDCDEDSHCAPNLECFQRQAHDDSLVPGCEGAAGVDIDYCIESPPTRRQKNLRK